MDRCYICEDTLEHSLLCVPRAGQPLKQTISAVHHYFYEDIIAGDCCLWHAHWLKWDLFFQTTKNTQKLTRAKYRVLNSLKPRQIGRHFADDIFKCIFLNENGWIQIKISLKFIPKGPINNIPALVQIMAWRHTGDKPLSEPIMVSLPTHICVTLLQWGHFAGIYPIAIF